MPVLRRSRSDRLEGSVERIAAGAGAGGVRVVDREALLLDGVDEVDGRALNVRRAHPVDGELHATELGGQVTVEGPVIEEQVVTQARAATRLNGDPQRQVVATLLVQQRLRLGGSRVGQDHAVRLNGRFVLNSHCSPKHPWGIADAEVSESTVHLLAAIPDSSPARGM